MSLNYAVPFGAYVVIASPQAYQAVRGVLGSWVANAEGLPTTAGLLLHSLVFVLLCTLLLRLVYSKKSKYGYGMSMYTHDEEKSE